MKRTESRIKREDTTDIESFSRESQTPAVTAQNKLTIEMEKLETLNEVDETADLNGNQRFKEHIKEQKKIIA